MKAKRLTAFLLTLALALLFTGGSACFGKQIVIRAGLIDPPGHIDTRTAERYAKLVSERTDGAVKIEVYPSSQLGFAMDMLQGLKLGTVQMFVGATTWLGAFEKDFWISGCLYVFND